MSTTTFPVGATIAVSAAEAYIHEGRAYVAFVKATVDTGQTVDILLTVPAGVHVHASPSFHADGAANVVILEGVTYSSGGSDFTPVNKDRNSARASTVAVKTGTLTVSGGATIWTEHLGTSKNSGGAAVTEFEWDLKMGVATLLRVTSGGNGNTITIAVAWNEPTS